MVTAAAELLSVITARKTFPFQGSLPRAGVVSYAAAAVSRLFTGSYSEVNSWLGSRSLYSPHGVTSPPVLFNPLVMLPSGAEERWAWSRDFKSYTDNFLWRVGKRHHKKCFADGLGPAY